jgi:hypothetical protein
VAVAGAGVVVPTVMLAMTESRIWSYAGICGSSAVHSRLSLKTFPPLWITVSTNRVLKASKTETTLAGCPLEGLVREITR